MPIQKLFHKFILPESTKHFLYFDNFAWSLEFCVQGSTLIHSSSNLTIILIISDSLIFHPQLTWSGAGHLQTADTGPGITFGQD